MIHRNNKPQYKPYRTQEVYFWVYSKRANKTGCNQPDWDLTMTMIDTGSNKRQYSQRPKDQGGDTFHQNGDWIKQRLSKKPNVPDVGHYMKGWIYHQWTCFDFVKHGKFCSAQQVEGDGVDPQSLIEENGSMGIFTDSTVKKQAVKNGIVRIFWYIFVIFLCWNCNVWCHFRFVGCEPLCFRWNAGLVTHDVEIVTGWFVLVRFLISQASPRPFLEQKSLWHGLRPGTWLKVAKVIWMTISWIKPTGRRGRDYPLAVLIVANQSGRWGPKSWWMC